MLLVALSLAPVTACAPTLSGSAAHAHVRATAGHESAARHWAPGTVLSVDVSSLSPGDAEAVFDAFDAWLQETELSLTVRRVRVPAKANVVFVGLDTGARSAPFRGRTTLSWSGRHLTAARVEVVLERAGRRIPCHERRRVLAHEIGHALGLGHSPRFSSIMYHNTPATDVDRTDRAALSLLYGSPTPVVVAASPDEI